jgi:hypothetical protein
MPNGYAYDQLIFARPERSLAGCARSSLSPTYLEKFQIQVPGTQHGGLLVQVQRQRVVSKTCTERARTVCGARNTMPVR